MKKILLITILILITEILTAQRNDSLYFNLLLTDVPRETIVNPVTKEFEIVVKKSSGTYTLFKKDNIEIGIKIYVNKIMEDESNITIIKYVFMQKTEG